MHKKYTFLSKEGQNYNLRRVTVNGAKCTIKTNLFTLFPEILIEDMNIGFFFFWSGMNIGF